MLNYSCRDQSELIGHAEAEKELIHSWNNGNIPNAWIFSGPKGIGKATLGYRLARFILAKENEYISNQEGLWVDPNSSTFKRISAGTHSDLFTLELTENEQGILRNEIVINDVRRLNRFLSLTSGESSWKIVIIDGADFLNSSAENALLKHIEETPYKSVFILVTHSLDKLLPTTRSRCRFINFKRLNESNVEKVFNLNPSCMELSEYNFSALVQISDGSPGYGLNLLNQGGIEFFQTVVELILSLPDLDWGGINKLVDRVGRKDGAEIFAAISDIILWTLSSAICRAVSGNKNNSSKYELLPNESPLIKSIHAYRHSLDQWAEVWEKVRIILTSSESLNMERKQTLFNAFTLLSRMARI